MKIGIIGTGAISGAYVGGCAAYPFLEIMACADLDAERAKEKAEEFGIPKACTVEELLADDDIHIVLNLTVPGAHTGVNLAAIEAGKHVYCEKPLALDRAEARKALSAADKRGLRVGCAPDTFLGAGGQTCRRLIDEGAIGRPVAATAFMMGHGHESWHPSPEFYYKPGGGPMFDMGPYYLTALVNLLGPVTRVAGSTSTAFPTRTITSEPLKGKVIEVETPTHVTGTMDFADGAIATVVMSFDVWSHRLPCIEIYGTEGTLAVPDPNAFRGPVMLRKPGDEDWQEVPLTHSDEVGRGIGVADMAKAIMEDRPHRVSGELAAHVLDCMQAFEESSDAGRHIAIRSSFERPAPLPTGLKPGEMD